MKDERIAALYEPVLNSFRDPITLINRNYVYEAANEAYCKALGRKREEILGRKVSELWGEEIFQTIIKLLLDRCLAGSAVRDEARFESGESQLRCYRDHVHPRSRLSGKDHPCHGRLPGYYRA